MLDLGIKGVVSVFDVSCTKKTVLGLKETLLIENKDAIRIGA